MENLYCFGLRGRLPIFISNFFTADLLKSALGPPFLIATHNRWVCTPQGSILPETLFLLKINSITQCLKPVAVFIEQRKSWKRQVS